MRRGGSGVGSGGDYICSLDLCSGICKSCGFGLDRGPRMSGFFNEKGGSTGLTEGGWGGGFTIREP